MPQTSPADEVNPFDALDVTPASALTSGPTSDPATDPDRPPPLPATTKLSGQDEKDYRAWLERIGMTHAKGGNVDEDYNGKDYDLRGFFDKYGPADINVKGGQHFTDEFKLPNHRTFSDQSKYATGPYAAYAGKWDEADNYYWGKQRYHEENVNPFDALDEPGAHEGTASSMRSALEQTGDKLPEVTISANRGPEASWSDVGSALSPTIGAKIESKLAGVEEYSGTEKYDSARKKLWQSMILPDAVRNARDRGIPLTEDDQVVDIARHLGIRPDQFTRDWPDYANQSDTERREFQAAQRERIQQAQPTMEEGGARRRMAAQVSEGARPNLRGVGVKSIAFDTATMIPDLLAGTAASLTPLGPVGGAAFMAADIAPDEYSAARNEGLDHRHASTYAVLTTLASSVPEIPVFKILDSAPAAKKIIGGIVGEKFGATAGGRVVGTTVAQGVTQATVQALQEGIDSGLLDRTDTLPDALKKIAAAGLTGAVAGVPMGGLHVAQHRFSEQGRLEADLARTRKKYPPKPTVLREMPVAGDSSPPAAANGAGTMPFGHESNPVQGNGAGTANPEANVPRGTPIAPDAPVSPHHQPELAAVPQPKPPAKAPEAELEPVALSGEHLRAALEAVDAKTISPPLLEALERMKLATRNDVNVPRLLPAGRRELAKAVPPAEQQGVVDNNIAPKPAELHPESTQNEPKTPESVPAAVPELPKPAEISQIKPKRARPTPVEPDLPTGTPGNRYLEDPQLRDALASMKGETGWAQVGGHVLRNEDTGAVTGRTTWIPNAEWWRDRPKGLTEPQVHAAVDKALAGEKLSTREQKMVDFMRDVHDERQKLDPFLPEHADMPHDLELDEAKPVPIDAAHETALVARLAEVDEGALESYAKQHEDDRQGFLRAVKAHLDAHDRETAGAGSESRQETTGVAEEKKGLDLFGQDTSRQQSLADETRRRDEKRSPNKDVSADTGRAGDLFSTNANRQMDLTQGHRYENTHSAGGHNVGDIVRIDSPGNEHHGERARILSLHRWRADEPYIARVGHEQGGQQTLELNQIKPSGQQDLVQQLEHARKETNTEPTEAQKVAGNYKKGTVSFGGMTVALENPRGSTRTGQSAEGKTWRRKMHADYGYVKGTEGHDGDAVDVFLTGHPDSGKVFVINQNHPDGSFDEHKAILGASNKQEAEATYLKHYPKGWKGLGSTEELSTEAFKEWVNSKDAKSPLRVEERRSDYETRKRVGEMSPEELRKELLTHELTGIPNRRAYVEAEKLPTQVSIDVDSLKWVNDNMGHESGNIVLKAIADSLSQHSDQVFHLSGDEFALQALHEREAHEVMAKVAEQLKGATIEVEMPDGKIVKLNGLGVSYGVGKDLHEADAALQGHKTRREKEGQRAPRGEAPPGAIVGAREEGGKDKTGGVAEETVGLPGSTARDETAKRLGDLLEAAVRRHSMEEQGQDLLDDMEEQGIHPRDVSEQFWTDTYWKLNGPTQRKFQKYLKALGFEPGSTLSIDRDGTREVAKDWQDVAKFLQADLPQAQHLEGIDRGYVALMRWANQQAAGLSHGGGESLMLKEDEAKYSPLSTVAGGVEAPRTPVAPGQRSLDLFAPRDNPTPATRAAAAVERAQPAPVKGAEPSRGKNRTALVRTGHFTSGTHNVRDWRDAAHILAPLRKEPRESLMAIVLDSAGRPLAIIRHTTGTASESLIEPHTLFGAIARVPGARAFYLGHNHPSGKIDQSNADLLVANRMHTLTRGSGIEMKGSMVVAPGSKWSTNYDPGNKRADMQQEHIRPAGRAGGLEVPIQERRLTRIEPHRDRQKALNANDVKRIIRESGIRSGALMLDAQLQVVGTVPITNEEMVKLRTGDASTGTARILREFENANANQSITFGDFSGALNNLGGMLKEAGIGPIETVLRDRESGELKEAGGGAAWPHFFSKRKAEPFLKWFGKSKVAAPDGEPLRVFHGTNQPIEKFDRERLGMMTKAVSAKEGFFFTDSPSVASEYAEAAGQRQRYDMPAYEKKMAELQAAVEQGELHARRTGDWEKYERALEAWENHDIGSLRANELEGQNIVPVYLKMENPLVHDFENEAPSTGDVRDLLNTARLQGHDGVIMKRVVDSPKGTPSNQYVVFDAKQVRSAITLKAQELAHRGGMPVEDLARVVHQTIRESGLEGNFPHVEVHEDMSTLPAHLQEEWRQASRGDGAVSAIFDPTTERIHMIAEGNATELEARENLWHEAVGHYGLRSAMDTERYNEVMDGISRDMPERVQATAYRNGLDLNNPVQRRVAAEEVIAYAAGQHLSGQEIDKPILPWWTQAVRAVKAFFAKMRGKPFYDDKAIAGLIQEAHTALERGTSFNGLSEGAARSQHAERFYSPVERAIGESKQGKASADQWMATIKKMAGVKPEELEWLGLEPWLKAHDGPVTKAELQDYVRANRLELEETTHIAGQAPEPTADEHKQTDMAEVLRADGHMVTFYESGNIESFFYQNRERRPLDPVYKQIDTTSPAEVEKLPPDVQRRVNELRDVSARIAAERERVAAAPNGWATIGGDHAPQYADYTLPGGKDYHELLIRLPETPVKPSRYNIFDRNGAIGWEQAFSEEEAERMAGEVGGFHRAIDDGDSANFHHGHWQQLNVVAHTRFKERTDVDGKRVLFLEEIQSDWHQKGRDIGYRDEARIRELEARNKEALIKYQAAVERRANASKGYYVDKTSALVGLDELREASQAAEKATYDQQQIEDQLVKAREAVPHAPFKTSWPMLVMKRMVRWAAEHGFERIAWTTGEQQNERYNLADRIDKITYSKDVDGHVWVYAEKNGRGVADLNQESFTPERLRETFGEAIAQKMLNDEGHMASIDTTQKFPERELTGLDLSIGGEGMRGFYDDILPRETNKLIKKFGARVTDARVGGAHAPDSQLNTEAEQYMEAALRGHGADSQTVRRIMVNWGEGGEQEARALAPGPTAHYKQMYEAAKSFPAHGFDITPEMSKAALSQGFPLFARRQAPLPLQQPGPKGFYERVRKAVDWLVENPVSRDVRKLTSPTNLSPESKEAARVAREYLGVQAAWGQRAQEALEHFARQIDKLPVQEQLDMMDRIEHGLPQAHAELQPAADGMRQMLDHWRDKVRDLGIGALDNFIENYFPHYWADPGDAKRLVASIQGRRPLKGPASFLKRRTIPTIKEGMDAGLRPMTVNPLAMTLLKTREMQRFITGVTLMKRYKEDGLAVFLKSGAPMPDGWAGIDDYIAKVRSWSEEEGGWIERGQYIMPEDAARIINNHVSSSVLKSFAPAQAFRVTANLLNAFQLGFSAFHLGFTTLDAIISKTALGMESMLHGEFGKAARNFGEVALGPLAAVNNVRRGHNLLQAYSNPIGATPEMAKLIKALEVAGGRAHMDKYYMLSEGVSPFRGVGVRSLAKDIHSALTQPTDRIRNVGKAVGNFAPEYATKLLRSMQALGKTHSALEIPFEVAGRLVRASTSWIMEHLVPMQKLGVFADLAKAHMDRHPNENPNDQADALQRIWASVDNRLGEMVYDNLFWNRTFKDTLHFGIRAVGWNVGTWREIGGAPIDAMKVIDKAIRTGKITADDIGHKIPYVLAMTMTTALYGAILNYLFTGEGPKEGKDYFFPRTGGDTNYGTPQRVSLPSYVKDVYEYSLRPGHTIMNKLNPIFNVIGEMWSNEDFFGNPITDPDAGFWDSLGERAKFVAGEAKPFSWQGAQQLYGSEKPGVMGGVKTVAPYVGIAPAPGYVTSPDQMERRERSEREKKYASHLKYLLNKAVAAKDVEEIKRLKGEYTDAMLNMKKTEVEVMKDRAKSAVSRRKAATSMRQQGFPATASLVASLPLEPDAAARQYFKEQGTA